MKKYRFPSRELWDEILRRPSTDLADIEIAVRSIVERVRKEGDSALREYTRLFDGVEIATFAVGDEEFDEAERSVSENLKAAIAVAQSNIEKFHVAQTNEERIVETMPGVECWRRSVAIERVGLYIPAGTAPLFSTVLMLAVPAKLAGCREVILCSPPNGDGRIAPEVLYTAKVCGVKNFFRIGGAQAIAALAFGTESVPRVDKIFGPGNSYVTAAKQLVSSWVAIDMPAGPSELLVFADETSNAAFVASDLLSQAEHGPDSQVILVSTSEETIDRTLCEIEKQIATLPRAAIARRALQSSRALLVSDSDEGIDLINSYAPEHLIIATDDAEGLAGQIVNAGSVFLGHLSCESAGDYATGTNHTLPTAGFARSTGGVSLDSFVKKITFQRLSAEGLRNIGPVVETMAAAEQLEAHRRAVSIRMEAIDGV